VSPGARATGPLEHALELPLVDRVDQTVTLAVGRAGRQGRHERRFALRGPLASVAGHWRIEPGVEGMRVRLSLAWEIAPAVKESAVNTLRSRSPLPIRTDADAILSRAVDEFFETRLAAQAGAYVDALCARVAGRPA